MSVKTGILCLFQAKELIPNGTKGGIRKVSYMDIRDDDIILDILHEKQWRIFKKERRPFSMIHFTLCGIYYSECKMLEKREEGELKQWYILYSNPKRLEKITSKTKKLNRVLSLKFKLDKRIMISDRVETREYVRKITMGNSVIGWMNYFLRYDSPPAYKILESSPLLIQREDQAMLLNIIETVSKKTLYAIQYSFSKTKYIEFMREYDKRGDFNERTFYILLSILIQASCILSIIHELPIEQIEYKYYGAFHYHSICETESTEIYKGYTLEQPFTYGEVGADKTVYWPDSEIQVSLLNYQLPIFAPFPVFYSDKENEILRTLVYEVPFWDLIYGLSISTLATPKERYVEQKFNIIYKELEHYQKHDIMCLMWTILSMFLGCDVINYMLVDIPSEYELLLDDIKATAWKTFQYAEIDDDRMCDEKKMFEQDDPMNILICNLIPPFLVFVVDMMGLPFPHIEEGVDVPVLLKPFYKHVDILRYGLEGWLFKRDTVGPLQIRLEERWGSDKTTWLFREISKIVSWSVEPRALFYSLTELKFLQRKFDFLK